MYYINQNKFYLKFEKIRVRVYVIVKKIVIELKNKKGKANTIGVLHGKFRT